MSLALDRLTELALDADRAHDRVTRALDLLRLDASDTEAARNALFAAQSKLNHINRQLVILGADDNRRAHTRTVIAEANRNRPADLPPIRDEGDVPLHLLTSPNAQTAARRMRDAADAIAAMERERGIEDGMAERLGDYADALQLEVFGPDGCA